MCCIIKTNTPSCLATECDICGMNSWTVQHEWWVRLPPHPSVPFLLSVLYGKNIRLSGPGSPSAALGYHWPNTGSWQVSGAPMLTIYYSQYFTRGKQFTVTYLLECDSYIVCLSTWLKAIIRSLVRTFAAVLWRRWNLCAATLSTLHLPLSSHISPSASCAIPLPSFYHLWLSLPSPGLIFISLQFSGGEMEIEWEDWFAG